MAEAIEAQNSAKCRRCPGASANWPAICYLIRVHLLKYRVLCIDDEASVCEMLRIMLQRHGPYHVEVETNALEAIARAHVFKPDLVFLDINMPDQSGLEIACRLREIPWFRTRPIVFFCGMPDVEERWARAVVSPSAEFLRKGIPLSKIVQVVEELLAMSPNPDPALAERGAAA